MKAKKLFPLVMLAAMGLVACGGGNNGGNGGNGGSEGGGNKPLPALPTKLDAPATLKVWATEAEEQVINDVVEKYNTANPTAKITIEYTAVSEADAATNVLENPNAEDAPDLFNFADDNLFKLVKKGALMKVGGLYEQHVKAKNTAGSIVGATYDKTLYGFPITNDNGFFMYYNSSFASEAEVDNLEGLLEKAKAAGKTVGIDIKNSWYAPMFIMAPEACGTESISWKADADKKVSYTLNWDNAKGVEVSEYIQSLYAKYKGTLVSVNNTDMKTGLKDGKMIACVSGTWDETPFTEAIGENLAATKLPKYHINGKAYQMATFTGSKVYGVNNFHNETKKAAMFLAELLTNKESQLRRFELRQALPCNIEASKDPRFTEHSTKSGAALLKQVAAAAAVQSTSVEGRYFAPGSIGYMGAIYTSGEFGEFSGWQAYLKAKADELRTPGI